MRKLFHWMGKDSTRTIMMAIDAIIMILLLYLYLMKVDLSTAPEFIYNQF